MVAPPVSDGSEDLVQRIYSALESVRDPEIPALSIRAIGILRDVQIATDGAVEVVVTPTYSGCPAIEMIVREIKQALEEIYVVDARVISKFNPAWTTDWIDEKAREVMRANGIAPPVGAAIGRDISLVEIVRCPRCNSGHTELISEFGATACKAQYRCLRCLEPFSYFKHF